ncbi:NUDIX domain-containing protein [Maritalea sp.]|uniref:NUDIX domain-containing protein n=1 Tax=Maritalea sp. TaxID=2003361 RepID=UPI003EF5FFCE
MGIDLTFKSVGAVFNVRAAGIIKHKGYMLCATEEELNYVYIPGGRVKRGEDSGRAFAREMREELDIDVEAKSPLIITESFYDGSDVRYHEFTFYYVIDKPESLAFAPGEICHVHQEEDKEVAHRWVRATADGLIKAQVEPQQLHAHFIDLPKCPIHVTIVE